MKKGAEQGPAWADELETARQGGYLWKIRLAVGLTIAALVFLVLSVVW